MEQKSVIPLFKVNMPESVLAPLSKTLLSGFIGQGPQVDAFESLLAARLQNKNVLTLNSGTSALHLALRLANVGHGDEVISTPMTCTATNVPILERGAKLVWADIDPTTGNLSPAAVRKKITKKTKAIVGVDWGGYPCDLNEFQAIAQEFGIPFIEDAAHAFGASYQGKPVGAHSNFVTFSFQAIKHITTVDGGALLCKGQDEYKRGKLLRWYGIDREQPRKDFRCEEDVKEHGYKFHMNDVCASIGIEQLKTCDAIIGAHQANGKFYRERFRNLSRVQLLDYKPDRESAYWLFTFRVQERLDFMKAMEAANIMVSQVHARNDTHTMFADSRTSLPGTDAFAADQVSIPVGWWLTNAEREIIASTVEKLCK